jgi:SsrA-binding protein
MSNLCVRVCFSGCGMKEKQGIKVVTDNRKARHDFHIMETYEAGMALQGTEVKSLRGGKANLKDAYARIENGEVFLYNMHISPYEQGNRFNHDAKRTRKLLMHKYEINKLYSKVREKGLTLVPLKVYFSKGRAKIELALAQGKKLYDKRQDMAERDAKREISRMVKERQRE